MFDVFHFGDCEVRPALFCAPMAGITHSAFRRLVADFGGYGCLFTEMLSASMVLHENIMQSPHTKTRSPEKRVLYQLQISGNENIAAMVKKLSIVTPFGIDLNLGCPAPAVRKKSGGMELFYDFKRLESVLDTLRSAWNGILTVKCRLGKEPLDWQAQFEQRIRLFEKYRISALCVHPRFEQDKLKRRPRFEALQIIKDQTALPIIANGDILSPEQLIENDLFRSCTGIMLGRIAVVKPWIFSLFNRALSATTQTADTPVLIDYQEVWQRFFRYTLEDFPEEKAIGRIKEFTAYFSKNFFYGHLLFSTIQNEQSLDMINQKARAFLCANPTVCTHISVAGI
ncbi:MAG: tRNA-dihydrouridine synthase family protein [Chitinivibrionales bacterium]|nr:tRNA-dihydrouridine synthase family protein [Chitinivibrionales bacterium]